MADPIAKTVPTDLVERLTRRVARGILRGNHAPGSKLPSIRHLASSWNVNISTVQRVLARLEQCGLVETRARSGVLARDPLRDGGTRVWAFMLPDAARFPATARSMLADALATRRLLVADVVAGLSRLPADSYLPALQASFDQLVIAAQTPGCELATICRADAEMLRTVLRAARRPTVLAIFNDLEAMLLSSSLLLEACYAEPTAIVAGWQAFLDLAPSLSVEAVHDMLIPVLTANDQQSLARLDALLAGESADAEQP